MKARLIIAVALLALAVAAPAIAHRHHRAGVPCRVLKRACIDRDAAITAARDAFRAATADARATRRSAVKPSLEKIRAARKARRAACHADRSSQACADARAAFRQTVIEQWPALRAARQAFRSATVPQRRTRHAAVRAARMAFRAAVRKALG